MSRRLALFVPLLSLLIALGCSHETPPLRASSPAWYEIAETTEIRAYLDTGRVERTPAGTSRIWMRFQYTRPIALTGDTTQYRAMETRQELDCAKRQTRGLELRMESAGGVTVSVPTPDGQWSSIDTHPLNSGVFLVACRATGHPIPVHGAT